MSIIIFFLYSTVFNSLAQLSFMSLIEYISTYLGSVCLLPYGPSVAYHWASFLIWSIDCPSYTS